MKLALLLAACAPIGSNVVVYTQKAGLETEACVRNVCLSTLLSLITIPLVLWTAEMLW